MKNHIMDFKKFSATHYIVGNKKRIPAILTDESGWLITGKAENGTLFTKQEFDSQINGDYWFENGIVYFQGNATNFKLIKK